MSQKTETDVLEQEEFSGITSETELRQFEVANQARILSAPFHLRLLFDERWAELTGKHYLVPATILAPIPGFDSGGGSSLPRDKHYHYSRKVNSIIWEKMVDKRGSKHGIITSESYYLVGELPDGRTTTIEFKLDKDQLVGRLGETIASKITTSKGFKGSVKADTVLEVIGYWEVLFSPKSHLNDTDDVVITWEGLCLQVQRNKRVVLHGYFLEVCDAGTYPTYIQTPQASRKITAWVQFYPYNVIREATEQEFVAAKAAGDAMQAGAIRKQSEV